MNNETVRVEPCDCAQGGPHEVKLREVGTPEIPRCMALRLRAFGATEALILLVIPESRSDVRDPATLRFSELYQSRWVSAFAGMTNDGVGQGFPGCGCGKPDSGFCPRVAQAAEWQGNF